MYLLLHILRKRGSSRPIHYIYVCVCVYFALFSTQGNWTTQRGQLLQPHKVEQERNEPIRQKRKKFFHRLLKGMVVLCSQPIQKTNYESRHKRFSALWLRSTSVCLFNKLMWCFSFHDLETKPMKQFYPLNLHMLLSAIIYSELSNWINSVILW